MNKCQGNTVGPQREETLVEKALGIKSRLFSLSFESNEIHGKLFGTQPAVDGETCGEPQIAYLEDVLKDILSIVNKLEDSLGDTRNRL